MPQQPPAGIEPAVRMAPAELLRPLIRGEAPAAPIEIGA